MSKIRLEILVEEEAVKKIEKELELLNSLNNNEGMKFNSVEEFIANYVEQLAAAEEKMGKIFGDQMKDLLEVFNKKGFDINEFFTSTFGNKTEEDKKPKEEDKKETKVEIKKS